MKKIVLCIVALFFAKSLLSQQEGNYGLDPANTRTADIMAIEESLPKSPSAASLGMYGQLNATPYNGKVNISVPIYTIDFEGMQIPIVLNYDTGGVRNAQEASWVGLNWTLSTNYGITQKVFGISDLGGRIGNEFDSDRTNGYIFNDISVGQAQLLNNAGGEEVFDSNTKGHSFDHIYDVHYSMSLYTREGSEPLFLDTQADVFSLNAFGKSYDFILKKKGTTNIVESHIFNSNTAIINLDLDDLSFSLIDEMGFRYRFEITEVSTAMSTVQNNASSPPGGRDGAFQYLFSGENGFITNANTLPSNWGLTEVTSPNGRTIYFDYETKGLYFSFPQYSFDNLGNDHYIFHGNVGSTTRYQSLARTFHNVSTAVIEKNYLTQIRGDFGKVVFELGNRDDLCTGSQLNTLANGSFGSSVLQTKLTTIRSCHGEPGCFDQTAPLSFKLDGLYVENHVGDRIVDVDFQHSYFNQDKSNDAVPSRYLRLKLDEVVVNERKYGFKYIEPNDLAAKDSYGVDFWGFANGHDDTNESLSPRFGRFNTVWYNYDGNTQDTGQRFAKYDGADRGAAFNFGKRGLLKGVTYPTGGATEVIYEPHEIVMTRPAKYEVTDTYNGVLRYTNMRDEARFNDTYHYLKNAKDPNYNYLEAEYPETPGNEITLDFRLNQIFNLDFPGTVQVSAGLRIETGLDGLNYWGDTELLVVENVNTGDEYPLLYFSDAPTVLGGDYLYVESETVGLGAGQYRLIRKSIYVPDGNYDNYPPTPAISINDANLNVTTFESLDEAENAIERFEIGGCRVKQIINKDINGDFISAKAFDYDYPDGFEGLSSSGKLMDELIFYKKTNGFYSYNPRFSKSYVHTGYNVLGGQPAAQGSHIGYSVVREYQLNELGENLGWVERQYDNKSNAYFTDSFVLPYMFNSNQGTGDPYISIFGFKVKWTCSGLTLGNDCDGAFQYAESINGENVWVKNTKVLGLPLRLSYAYSNGNVTSEKIYNQNGILKQLTENNYTYLDGNVPDSYFSTFKFYPLNSDFGNLDLDDPVSLNVLNVNTTIFPRVDVDSGAPQEGIMLWGMNHSTYYTYKFPSHYGKVSKLYDSKTIVYDNGPELAQEQINTYDDTTHFVKENISINSKNEELKTVYYYPGDPEVASQNGISDLLSENKLSQPVLTESYIDDSPLQAQKILFSNNENTLYNVLPTSVETSKNTSSNNLNTSFEPRMSYESYGRYGTLQQSSVENGIPVSYIWGYNDQYIVAKLENVTNEDLSFYTTQIKLASNEDNDRTIGSVGKEGELRDLLANLRTSFPNAMVTTFTYDPMIGVTSITDPKGYTIYYDYDSFNRLLNSKDEQGNLIEDYDYKYSDGVFNGEFSNSPYISPEQDGNVIPDKPLSVKIRYGNSGATFQTFRSSVSGGNGGEYTYEWFLSTNSSGNTFLPDPIATTSSFTLDIRCDEYRYVKLVVTNGSASESDIKINANAPCGPGDNPDNVE